MKIYEKLGLMVLFDHTRQSHQIRRYFNKFNNGDKEARTPDPYNAIVVLYQLSYDPKLVLNLLDRALYCQVGFSS